MNALRFAGGLLVILVFWISLLLFATTISALLLRLSCKLFNRVAGVTNRSEAEISSSLVDRPIDSDDDDNGPQPRIWPEELDPAAPGVPKLFTKRAMKICGIHVILSLVVGIVIAIAMHLGSMYLGLDRGNPFTPNDITKCVWAIDIVIGYFLMVGLLCIMLPTTFRKANGVAGLYIAAGLGLTVLVSLPFFILGVVLWAIG
jgi:hypothetical protein